MAVQKYEFAYGRGTQSFEYDDADVLKVVRTEPQPILEDVKGHLLDMLEHPIGLPPLSEIVKPGDTVAFICNDPTRVANSFVFMPILVNELNRLGVPDANMRIVFALGTHRAMTHEEMVEQVGEEVAGRLPMFNSIATNADDFQYFGKTTLGTPVWINKLLCDVDHVFLTGTIVHHYFSGYGGGRKAVLPGCAAMETVRMNHSHMLSDKAGLGLMEGNAAERLLAQLRGVDKLSPAVQQQRNAEIAVVRADVRSARTLRHEPGAAFQPRGDRQPHRPHAARQRAASCCQ